MLTSFDLINVAEQNKIDIEYIGLPICESISMPLTDNACVIALDTAINQAFPTKEKVMLAHEMGHCMTYSFYSLRSEFYPIGKLEHRANRWAVHNIIPFEEFDKAINNGYDDKWSLAEHFGVTVEFIEVAEDIYRREGLLA